MHVSKLFGGEWIETSSVGVGSQPTLAISTYNVPYVAWTNIFDNISLLWGSDWAPLGNSNTNNGISATSYASAPSVALLQLDPNVPCVAWQDSSDWLSDSVIYVRCWDEDANEWIEIGGKSASDWGISFINYQSYQPKMAVSPGPDGTIYVMWVEGENDSEIYIKKYHSNP